jgi:hypothetical protein
MELAQLTEFPARRGGRPPHPSLLKGADSIAMPLISISPILTLIPNLARCRPVRLPSTLRVPVLRPPQKFELFISAMKTSVSAPRPRQPHPRTRPSADLRTGYWSLHRFCPKVQVSFSSPCATIRSEYGRLNPTRRSTTHDICVPDRFRCSSTSRRRGAKRKRTSNRNSLAIRNRRN